MKRKKGVENKYRCSNEDASDFNPSVGWLGLFMSNTKIKPKGSDKNAK
jgi:hypothetical protein